MPPSPPLRCVIVPVTPFAQNCSILWCTETMRGAIVDPGGDIDRLLATAAEQQVTIEKILLTHGHLDHAGATADLAERLGVAVEGPQREDISGSRSSPRTARVTAWAGAAPSRPSADSRTATG